MAETVKEKAVALPTGALSDAGQRLLGLLVQRAAEAATDRVSAISDRLTSVSENEGRITAGLRGRHDGSESPRGALSRGLGALKEKATELIGGGNGKGKKLKVTTIVEDLDVGLPLRTTYNLWTQFADFPSFMKKVESVEQASDETTNWKAQVLWSHRTWEATIVEQVPDSHIAWRSKGAKGHVDGAVTFTGLGPNLTRVLLVLEYHPQGLFEHTGNLWRAQGRRARLEFKHFRRHAMSNVLLDQQEVEGWRGEIHDSEIVKTHEEALEEEREREAAEEPGAPDEDAGQDAREDEYDEAEGYDDAEGYDEEGAYEDEAADYEDEDEYTDEDEAEPAEDESADYEDEDTDEYADEDEAEPAEDNAVADQEREPEPARSRRGGRR